PAAHAPGGARRRRGLIGRERHLAQLAAAYANATGGDRPVVARVVGESGVGKSALVAAFLQSLGDEDGAPLVLSGRCYERERVPYKAVDALVDALADAFAGPGVDAAGIVPHHAAHLMRVFPVLRRVEAFAHAPVPAHEVRDPLELRARVFAAFRDLFERLATARPVVIAVDDLQWADDDGLALLADLVRPPDAPPLLLVATIRSGHEERTRALDAAGDVRTIYVDRLAPRDAARLARELLRDAELPVDLAADLAAEADGHPLFIDALVRHVAQSGGARARLRLDDALRARAAAQSPACRRLLDVVCVQGAPIAQRTAAAAAGVADADVQAAVDALCADKLVRSGDGPTVEPYHDRVREAVCAAMAPDRRRAIHRRLASAIEEHGGAAPERLAEHYREAGDVDRAARAAVDAARRASEALAFDRAARLYAVALSLGALPPQDARSVRIALGDALAHAARGPAAAEAYLAAADGAPPALAASLRARAADQYLKSGHIDDGLAVTRQVLATLGMKLARTPRTALWSLAWRRALLRLRGTRFAARPADAVPDAVLERIDLCWSVARGLSMVDTIRSAAFQTRHQALALRAGEPSRVVRALAIEVGHAATAGVRGQRRAERLLARAERLAIEVGAHESLGFVELAGGIAAFLVGDWRATVDRCDRALPIFRDRCVGAGWEIANARLFAIWALVFLGELAEVRRRVPAMLEDAQLRGDLYAETCAQTGLANLAWLAAGEVDDAAAHIDAAERRWSQRGFHFQHYWSMLARGNHDLYVGSPARSYRRVVEQWAGLRASQYLRIENVRVEAWHLRGRLALAAAVATHDAAARAELADAARRAARRLARERSRWAGALAHALRAGLAHASGDVDRAIVALRRAEDAASRADLRLLRQCARWRRGQLEGGDAGATLQRDAAAWLARHGVADVERMVGVWLPGFAV
ncbi:MAG: serine/threonine-protein kinase PknK, partial [Deltaproteobacteria bacterium]